MNDLARIFDGLGHCDRIAADELLPLVYQELRRLAATQMAQENPGQTLDATALVHETWLRLVGSGGGVTFDNRGHFLAAAAKVMRWILVDAARRKHREKHGRDWIRISTESIQPVAPEPREDLVELHLALTRLAEVDPQAAELVELRHFAGLTVAEAARALEISPRTADRLWAYARAWLHRELADTVADPNS